MNIDDLLEKTYWIVDILPEQVPKYSDGQYSAVEQYFLKEPQFSKLRRKYADIILKLNCYYDISILTDYDEEPEMAEPNPDPEKLIDMIAGTNTENLVRIFIRNEFTMIDLKKDETCMTIYNPADRLLTLIRRLAVAEGLFMWKPAQ